MYELGVFKQNTHKASLCSDPWQSVALRFNQLTPGENVQEKKDNRFDPQG